MKQALKNFQDCILKYRKSSLVAAGILGLMLAMAIYCLTSYLSLKPEILQSSLTILFLGIPTLFIIWLFRTHDVQRQIDKTQESINNSSFFECARMLTTESDLSRKMAFEQIAYIKNKTEFNINRIGDSLSTESAKHQYVVALEQLAYLRRETGFDKKRIDLLTKNLVLKDKNLKFTQLSGINLSGANLEKAYLTGACLEIAKLSGANLQGVDFVSANLRNADLEYSDIRDADLRNATLEGTKFRGTKYNAKTEKNFPEGFAPEGKHMDYKTE